MARRGLSAVRRMPTGRTRARLCRTRRCGFHSALCHCHIPLRGVGRGVRLRMERREWRGGRLVGVVSCLCWTPGRLWDYRSWVNSALRIALNDGDIPLLPRPPGRIANLPANAIWMYELKTMSIELMNYQTPRKEHQSCEECTY